MASVQEATTLNVLPDEVLQHVLFYIPAQDIIENVQLACKRFHRLGSEPLLWRQYCKDSYQYWDSKHRIQQKFMGKVGDVDWKRLYLHRSNVSCKTSELLDDILNGQTNRIRKFDQIEEFGYDAKDTLLRHCKTSADAEDALSRRYYATAVLDFLHRSKALAEWSRLARGEHVPIERALGGFDLFVLHDQHGDLQEISQMFDDIAVRLHAEYPQFDSLTLRQRALSVIRFLRAQNLVGLNSDVAYRDLQNNYIGIALQDSAHPSLPLISVGIYCAVAKRLGLDARSCGIPNHVHAIIYPHPSEPLDGEGGDMSLMYLDPYRSEHEVPVAHIREMLSGWGISAQETARFLAESSSGNLILRTSRNILATIHEFRGQGESSNTGHPTIKLHANPFADMDNAFYSALWANFMLSSPVESQRQFVQLIVERFERLYPMDASLIEKHIYPLYNSPGANGRPLYETVRVVRAADATPRQLKLRNIHVAGDRVKYKVGQVFRHKRYGYAAVITGWDFECGMNSEWIAYNDVDSLDRGRHQSFYHALVEDTSIRYVAEENVEIHEPGVPTSLMGLAGKFFKRWDRESKTFVSNIRDEFPED
ncbi:Hemimethylated DNA-binding protein YccV like-domain-containing protein [Calycina marina]|uniref:Hemimethylated DNA-binding protein YccV like-domain-containing protein n=1 Tax=Calycina marina TaxID=1763456 RepID=A0A9P7ZBR4_9HELO|nr:Hemimethylated DNA-binding protein YccV like-domain-containing protein [Calycina marina]